MEFLKKYYNIITSMLKVVLKGKIVEAIKLSGSKIFFSILGNLFPIYTGALFLTFLKEDFKLSELTSGQNLIIFSATFIISSFYLWKKNSKENDGFLGMIIHILLILFITILFTVSYLEDYHNKDLFNSLTIYVFITSIIVYVFYEIRNTFKSLVGNNEKERKKDFKDLDKKFDEL